VGLYLGRNMGLAADGQPVSTDCRRRPPV